MKRDHWFWAAAVFCAVLAMSAGANSPTADSHDAHVVADKAAGPSPSAALRILEESNLRFAAGGAEGPRRDQDRRCETFTHGQHPIAAVLACADSRSPVELLFDAGIGDLFVVRVAGNVADVDELGTLEYGVDHLEIPLVVVLGHVKCGAVTAVVEGAQVHGNIAKLVDNIAPAAAKTRQAYPSLKGPALVAAAVKMNVWQSMEDTLVKSDVIRNAVANGKLKVVGGVYDLHSGAVEWMGEHPHQAELLRGIPTTRPAAEAGAGELTHPVTPKIQKSPPIESHKSAGHEPAVSHAATHTDPHADAHDNGHVGHAASDGPSKPAAAKSAKKSDTHDAHSATEEYADAAHAAPKAKLEELVEEPEPKTAAKPVINNYWALGTCALGGAMLSAVVLSFMRPRMTVVAAPAPAAVPAPAVEPEQEKKE